jgi:hypothetical protein
MTIYILELESGKYYIGKSDNVEERVSAHFDGKGSVWTKRYSPIEVIETIDNCDEFDEDKYTKRYMAEYGIDNVRGGSYTTMSISQEDRSILERELATAYDLCFKCMKRGHFSKDCPSTGSVHSSRQKQIKCYRCGRNNHISTQCYARTHLDGTSLNHTHPNHRARTNDIRSQTKALGKQSEKHVDLTCTIM